MTNDLTYSQHPESDPMEGAQLADAVRILRKMAGRDGLVTMTWTYDVSTSVLVADIPDFRIVGALPIPAFSAIARGLSEVYPDARLTTGPGYFGIILGEQADEDDERLRCKAEGHQWTKAMKGRVVGRTCRRCGEWAE